MGNFDEILYRLIRNNKRVIIPDIGAFITNPADENIVFSPLLKHNDGFLENEIKKEGIADPVDFLREFAKNVITMTEKGQHYYITGLGYFFKDEGIRFMFEIAENTGIYEHSGRIYLSEKRKNRKRIWLIASSICLSLCVLSGIFIIYNSKKQLDMFISQLKKIDNQFVIIDKLDDFNPAENKTNGLQLSSQTKTYHIIVACFEEKINAENFVLQCKKIGYDETEILYFTDVLYPVSIGKFASLDDALDKKRKYDNQFGENSLIIKIND
ncbi:MAG: hypothetical protein LBS55_10920 [Prevotellaceae bacterium]|jgi:hypothetical protein|nr:hypothetical protein [Prevotellaceae bacterium]